MQLKELLFEVKLMPGIEDSKQDDLQMISIQCKGTFNVSVSGRAQWLRGRASDSRLREPGFESWLWC